jgi:ribosomal protein L34E
MRRGHRGSFFTVDSVKHAHADCGGDGKSTPDERTLALSRCRRNPDNAAYGPCEDELGDVGNDQSRIHSTTQQRRRGVDRLTATFRSKRCIRNGIIRHFGVSMQF